MGRSINNASHDQAYNFLIGEWAKNPKLTEQKLADLIKSNHFDIKYGLTVKDVVNDIRIYKKDPNYKPTVHPIPQIKPQPIPVTMPKPNMVTKPAINKRGNIADARRDASYVFLIGEWAKSSNLTEKKLVGLIQSNHLDIKYGITVTDVIADIRKYKNDPTYNPFPTVPVAQKSPVSNQQPTMNPLQNISGGIVGKASNDSGYIFLIGEWSKNANLTEKKLAGLIQSNHFDIKYGLTVADVVADIKAYKNNSTSVTKNQKKNNRNVTVNTIKPVSQNNTYRVFKSRKEYAKGLADYNQAYKDSAFLDGNIEKFAKKNGISLSTDHILSIRMDLLQLQMGKRPNSSLYLSYIEDVKVDSSFCKDFKLRVTRYLYIANEYKKFRGVLLDLLPEYKREVNMLSQLLSIGIVDDLQREKKADPFLISRYIKRMSDDYGYDEILISEIVNMWCDEYTQYLTNN